MFARRKKGLSWRLKKLIKWPRIGKEGGIQKQQEKVSKPVVGYPLWRMSFQR